MTLVIVFKSTATAATSAINDTQQQHLIPVTATSTTITTTSSSSSSSLLSSLIPTSRTTKSIAILNFLKHTFSNVAPSSNTIVVNSGTSYSAVPLVPVEGSRLRKRHSKRHSNWYDFVNFNENTTELEWMNPCGGFYVPSVTEGRRSVWRKNPKQVFNLLKRSAGNEYKTLKAGQQSIDISDIHVWSLHNKTYKFLPKLKSNSTIALKRWYRNIQSYVASFAYLRRIQRNWDMAKLQHENSTARELKMLLFSARRMLCELETAINGTRPAGRSMRGINRLPHVTRTQMNKRLKLYTKRRAEKNPKTLQEANTIDLMWVKYYYYEFLEKMWKVLRQKTKRPGQVALMTRNSNSFNEVEKHFGSIGATILRQHELPSNSAGSGFVTKRSKSMHFKRGSNQSSWSVGSVRDESNRSGDVSSDDSVGRKRLAHARNMR